jgi:hypothetical protein
VRRSPRPTGGCAPYSGRRGRGPCTRGGHP